MGSDLGRTLANALGRGSVLGSLAEEQEVPLDLPAGVPEVVEKTLFAGLCILCQHNSDDTPINTPPRDCTRACSFKTSMLGRCIGQMVWSSPAQGLELILRTAVCQARNLLQRLGGLCAQLCLDSV